MSQSQGQPGPSIRNIEVQEPIANSTVKVRAGAGKDPTILCDCTGTICARGKATKTAVTATAAHAKVYRTGATVPALPTSDAKMVVPDGSGNWQFIREPSGGPDNELPNAFGNNCPRVDGDNKLVVWVQFSDGCWDPPSITPFKGQCATTTECG